MQVALGAKVRTADGKQIGSIDKLILEPDSGDIRAIVVQKGLLFKDDIEIELDGIVGQDGDVVQVRYTEKQLGDLPRFSQDSYTTPPPEFHGRYADQFGPTETTLLWPAGGAASPHTALYGTEATGDVGDEISAMHLEQDISSAVIEEGSEVRSRDDEKVGSVHRAVFDPATGRPSALVVRKGFLFTEDVELPASLIASVDDGVVYLNVDKEAVRQHAGRQPVHPPVI
jgi:uncharacterized protein YrrD